MQRPRDKDFPAGFSSPKFGSALDNANFLKGRLPEKKRRRAWFPANTAVWKKLTVWNLIWPLPFLINNYDNYKNDDLGQNSQEGPERSQVAAYTQDGDFGGRVHGVGGIALVIPGIFADVEALNTEFGVILFVVNEEATRRVVNTLIRKGQPRAKLPSVPVILLCAHIPSFERA